MKKLLLLALLGLGLGGGVWKAQNPDGTLDELKTQSTASIDRLKAGFDAVIGHPDTLTAEAELDERMALVEQQLSEDNNALKSDELKALIDEKLAENANSLSSLRESLNERVAPMEDVTVAVAELDTALQDTRARTDSANVRLDAIDRRLELLVRRLDEQTTETDLQALVQTVEELQARTDTLQDGSDDRQAELNEAMVNIVEQTGALALRLDTLVDNTNATNSTEPAGDSRLGLSAGVDKRLKIIEERLATVNSDSRRIAILTEQLEAARSKIAELEQQDEQSSESLAELNASLQALTTVGESLSIDSIQAQIQDQLALAQLQFDSSASDDVDTTQLEALVDTTRNRLQTLEQRVQGLPATSSEADDALQTQSALQAQVAELEQRLENLTSTDPALQSAVNDVKQQVEQLSAKGFVTQDELRAKVEAESIEYKIYFDRNSTDITEDAAQVLDSFIAQEKNRTTGVSIFGFTDRIGSAAYNQQLALQRATNVRSYLIQNGLDFTKIKALTGLGEDAAAAIMPDEAVDAQQRVVVLFAAQP